MRKPLKVRPAKGLRVRPAKGLRVRKEDDASIIPEEGCTVPDTRYYRRRIADGSLLDQTEPEKKAASKGDDK